MNIGIFTNAYKPIISGVVNSIELIKQGMESRGHKVYIFAPGCKGYKDEEENVYRFSSVNLTNRVKFPLAIPYSYSLFSMIPYLDLDIIHTHHPFLLGEVGAGFSKKLKIPLVYTFHTQFEQYSHYIPFPQDLVKKLARFSVVNYAQKCSLIICPSTSILSLLKNYGITSPIEFIPNAVDLRSFKKGNPQRIRDKYNISEEEKLLIYVGRIGLEKNLGFMLQAFKNIKDQVPEAKLMIVGEGPELESTKELAKYLGINERVIFPGRVEYKEIPSYFAAGYAFIMTSTTEVKPLALLEAMASGLPVAAISAAGSSDTINHNFDGLLTPYDMEAFCDALLKILKDQAFHDRLSIGALKTSENYSIDTTSKKLEDLYKSLSKKNKVKAVC